MNKNDIKDRINVINERLNEMVSSCEAEQRHLNEDETNEKAALLEERGRLDEELNKINTNTTNFKQMENETKKFSLLEAVRTVANGGQFVGEYADEVRSMASKSGLGFSGQIQVKANAPERRDTDGILTGTNNYTSGTYNGGHEMVRTDVLPIIDALYNYTILDKGGANFYNGLIGDVKLPILGNTTFGFKAENAAADNVTPTMGKVDLTPKRITGYIYLSKQLLNQTSEDLEARLRQNIALAVAQALEKAIFGYGTSPHNGVMYNATTVAKASVTYDTVLAQAETLYTANFMPSFVVNPMAARILKQKARLSYGTEAVMYDGMIDNAVTFVTNNINVSTSTSGCLAAVDFTQLHIGTWGDLLDIVVDPYSRASYGEVVLTLNYYCDWGWASSSAHTANEITTV